MTCLANPSIIRRAFLNDCRSRYHRKSSYYMRAQCGSGSSKSLFRQHHPARRHRYNSHFQPDGQTCSSAQYPLKHTWGTFASISSATRQPRQNSVLESRTAALCALGAAYLWIVWILGDDGSDHDRDVEHAGELHVEEILSLLNLVDNWWDAKLKWWSDAEKGRGWGASTSRQ
jgi:hypothetical protein